MTLIDTGLLGPIRYMDCLCGRRSNDYKAHYLHIVQHCVLDRCVYCFRMLGGDFGDDPTTHRCQRRIS